MTYYHCSILPLKPGSVILPGNFGRNISLYKNAEPLLGRELVFEAVRFRKFPSKPSRLKSAFVFKTLNDAKIFKNTMSQTTIVYEVQLENENANSHTSNMKYFDLISGNVPRIDEIAAAYWAYPAKSDYDHLLSLPMIEIVTESGLEIIQQI